MVGSGHCPMILKYGPSLSKAVGPVDPSFLVVKKSHFNKNIYLTTSLRSPQNRKYMQVVNTVKHVLSSRAKTDKTKVFITNGSLMKVESIAECSPWSILQYFWPALNDNWSSFLSGRLRQVLLYTQQSIYIYAYKCLCQCVGKVITTQMSTVVSLICFGPSFQKMTHHFLLHGSLWPTNLEKNLKPWLYMIQKIKYWISFQWQK